MSMTSKLSIFVDESGDTNLPTGKPGRSDFYILNAVIVDAGEVADIRAAADAIRAKSNLAEIHSADIRSEKNRVTLLTAAVNLKIKTYTFVVDKRELNQKSGLGFKDTFYKYINRKFYEKLVQNWREVEIYADEYGTEHFMKRFKEYLARENKGELFSPRFDYRSSKEEPLLQIADLIGGTIGKCVDPSKRAHQREQYIELISKVSIGIACWPARLTPPVRQNGITSSSNQFDVAIQEYSFQLAREFLTENRQREADELLKVEIIEYLLYMAEWINERKWVQTDELLRHLHKLGYDINAEKLRRSAIGPLRDDNLIIASSSRGYKLPVCLSDVNYFVQHTNSIVPPMLRRLKRARDALHAKTLGALDILAAEDLGYLRRVLKVGEPLEASQEAEAGARGPAFSRTRLDDARAD